MGVLVFTNEPLEALLELKTAREKIWRQFRTQIKDTQWPSNKTVFNLNFMGSPHM